MAMAIDLALMLPLIVFLGWIPVLTWMFVVSYLLLKDSIFLLNGQSIGKKLMKIRAVDEETLEPITNLHKRAIFRMMLLFIPFFVIVEIVMMFNKTGKSRRFGDRLAGTIVINENLMPKTAYSDERI